MQSQLDILMADNARMKAWLADLQSGMFINCVYCGHRYGPKDQMPATLVAADPAKIKAIQEKINHLPKTIELKQYRRQFAEIYLGRPATDKEITIAGDAMTDTWNGPQNIYLADLKTWVPLFCADFQRRLTALGETPTVADALKEHIKVCPQHPLSKTIAALTSIRNWSDEMWTWKDAQVRAVAMIDGTLGDL